MAFSKKWATTSHLSFYRGRQKWRDYWKVKTISSIELEQWFLTLLIPIALLLIWNYCVIAESDRHFQTSSCTIMIQNESLKRFSARAEVNSTIFSKSINSKQQQDRDRSEKFNVLSEFTLHLTQLLYSSKIDQHQDQIAFTLKETWCTSFCYELKSI